MTVAEAWQKAKEIVGPPPAQPVYRDPITDPGEDEGGVLGGEDDKTPPQPFQSDPNNALLLQQYQTEVAAYNSHLQLIFQALLSEK